MSLRKLSRRLMIDAAVGLRLDALARRRQRRAMRQRRTQLVRVLLLHGSPAACKDAFRRQLSWLRENFELIDFAAFKRMWESDPQDPPANGRPSVLFTFDDGIASNYEVAAPLLEEFGTRGVFFIVPSFSQGDDGAGRIYTKEPPEQPWKAITPQQLRELADRGHTIGSHTWSHTRLSETPEAQFEQEIVRCAEVIESWTGRRVETFAWTYHYDAITPAAHRLICQRHAFCFSPCPGLVDVSVDSPRLIWRTHVETSFGSSEYRFMCSGLADPIWAQRRAQLASVLDVQAPAMQAR